MSAANNVTIVLVEPSSPGNIGSVARVLKNTGLSRLALVNPGEWLTGEARRMAHGSREILEACEVHADLAAAVATSHLVIGTTHRLGRSREVNDDFRPVLAEAAQLTQSEHRVAIVFGRERDGLWHREISHCHRMVRIPAAVPYPSFNLSHAVLVIAYELFRLSSSPPLPPPAPDLATAEQQERVYDHILRAMAAVDLRAYNGDLSSYGRVVRRFLNRSPLNRRDAMVVHRFCNQIRRFVRRHGAEGEGAEGSPP